MPAFSPTVLEYNLVLANPVDLGIYRLFNRFGFSSLFATMKPCMLLKHQYAKYIPDSEYKKLDQAGNPCQNCI